MDIRIRKVKVLRNRARREADKMGLDDNDLVILETDLSSGFPIYKLTKIEGDTLDFIQNKYLRGR